VPVIPDEGHGVSAPSLSYLVQDRHIQDLLLDEREWPETVAREDDQQCRIRIVNEGTIQCCHCLLSPR
jgi:hypothetical protein